MWPTGVALASEAWSEASRPMLAGLIGTTFPTSILALHDVSVALTFATRLIGLDGGRIALDMPAQDAKTAAIEALYAR